MYRLKSFYLFLLSAAAVLGFFTVAKKEPLSFGLLIAAALMWLFIAIKVHKSRKRNTRLKSSGELMWKRLSSNRNAMAGMVVLLILAYLYRGGKGDRHPGQRHPGLSRGAQLHLAHPGAGKPEYR